MLSLKSKLSMVSISISCAGVIALAGCGSGNNNSTPVGTNSFVRSNLVSSVSGYSDSAGAAAVTDVNLKNPWAIAYSPTGPFWLADNHAGLGTVYNGAGANQGVVVTIPSPGAASGGAVTGQVYSTDFGFLTPPGNPSKFIFATEDGTICAWSSSTTAFVVVNRTAAHSIYKGLAIGAIGTSTFIYATDFYNGTVDMFNSIWGLVTPAGAFTDPGLPAGFAPFGIQNIEGKLYVTYAKQDAAKADDVAGAGLGIISVFNLDGTFVRRFATGSAAGGTTTQLNAPWGLAIAPADYGYFSNALLVGNFGDGRITAFNALTGAPLGQLQDPAGAPVTISGLWGLTFGNGASAGAANVLYFAAGINGETDGLFGSIAPTTRKPAALK